VLVGVSLTSHEKTLAPGENKYFCEIDCHIAYSVVNFEGAKALGDEAHQTLPAGRFVIVRLKTWFDPSTISEHRGDSPLGPSPRRVVLVDDAAQPFPESAQGKAALARLGGGTIPLSQPLRPGHRSRIRCPGERAQSASLCRRYLRCTGSPAHRARGQLSAQKDLPRSRSPWHGLSRPRALTYLPPMPRQDEKGVPLS